MNSEESLKNLGQRVVQMAEDWHQVQFFADVEEDGEIVEKTTRVQPTTRAHYDLFRAYVQLARELDSTGKEEPGKVVLSEEVARQALSVAYSRMGELPAAKAVVEAVFPQLPK